eukprot:2749280-Pleurochrysis_carterae.AAC.1
MSHSSIKRWLGQARDDDADDATDKPEMQPVAMPHELSDEPMKASELFDCLQRADRHSQDPTSRRAFVDLLDLGQRQRLYRVLWKECVDKYAKKLSSSLFEYRRYIAASAALDEAESLSVLRDAAVVGMTTTGAAKHQALITKLGCKVIVMEEAAEVLEAHVLAALGRETQQLLLIGDHKQLRPGVQCYELTKDYALDVSLFERCHNLRVPFECLRTQRRMRPAIARNIHPIYPELRDHPCTLGRPSVVGFASNVHFLTHEVAEFVDSDLRSPKNPHERDVVLLLTATLLGIGYSAKQITILSAYVGQLMFLRSALEQCGMGEVLITTVDNYQGEENDIVVLTLVRSNHKGTLGFTAVENRICVALSRARLGFYCTCNLEMLARGASLWEQTQRRVEREGRVSAGLPLLTPRVAEKRREREARLAEEEEWEMGREKREKERREREAELRKMEECQREERQEREKKEREREEREREKGEGEQEGEGQVEDGVE